MKYACFDDSGFPVGFYAEDIHGARSAPDTLIPSDAVEITEAQWRELLEHQGTRRWQDGQVVEFTPPGPTTAQLMTALRVERDRLLDASDRAVRRHEDQKALGVATTISEQQFTDLLAYRQALRDLPEDTTDPANPVWPVNPLAG